MKKTSLLILTALLMTALLSTGGCVVPGGGDDDNDGFKIKNIEVINISETAVKIDWETSDSSNCQIFYGQNNYSSYASDSSLSMIHTLNLQNLMPSSDYKFKIIAETPDSRFDEVENRRFSTMADTVAPVISNIRLLSTTSNSMSIAWETNEVTNSLIKWGETAAYNGMQSSDNDSTTEHYTTISGLQHVTDYHIKIDATDISGNSTSSNDTIFRTSDLPVVKFAPDTIEGYEGDTIDVSIQLDVDNLAALAFLLEYNNLKIDILKVEQAEFFIENSGNIFQVENPLVTQLELIAAWMINYDGIIPVGTGATGTGNVCTLKIELLRDGETEIRFIRDDTLPVGRPDGHPDSQLYDMSDNYMSAHWYNLYINILPDDD
ncbi:MAG: hypothetical protein ACLFSQ_06185 [Candidatus Zixiibacteriota bacterium]